MADKALTTFLAAEDALRAGRYLDAVGNYLRVIKAVPQYFRARFRVADTILNLKRRDDALRIYNALAWHAIKAGQPLEGLVATKMAIAMDPGQKDVIEIVAQLYSKASDRVAPGTAMLERRLPTETDDVEDPADLAGDALVDAAVEAAAATDGIATYPDKLPSIPLFSFLDEDAFVSVLEGLQLKRYVQGQAIIQEGQAGDSFFILAEGDVTVSRNMRGKAVPLAKLHPGAVFGEMALISKAPRTATVAALVDCDLLELRRAALEDKAHELASVTQALREFTHDRFLTNLTATSPIFKPFPRSMRHEIIKKFQDFPVDPGDELIGEGEEGQGLFLILKGTVEVTKKGDGGSDVTLATLKEGDCFGEISLIQDSPTTASCSAVTRGQLLFLPKRDFTALTARHPELKDELSKITAERIQQTKDLMEPEEYELIEDDDLIML